MDMIRVIRNEDVKRVLIGTPEGHKHLRVCIRLKDGTTLIFQEATIANIFRAYVTLKTHPSLKAQELKVKSLKTEQLKEGYAPHQLIETARDSSEVERELKQILEKE